MNNSDNKQKGELAYQIDLVISLLKEKEILTENSADTLAHALVDIYKSLDKIYNELLPKLSSGYSFSKEELEEQFCLVKDEFLHIDYHIHDAKLATLTYEIYNDTSLLDDSSLQDNCDR